MLFLLLFAAVMLVLYIREKLASYSVKAVLLKSVVSVQFIAVAVLGWYLSSRGILGIFVIIGLTFGLLGDIWLDLKYVFRDYNDQFTYAGFTSFGFGHILYIAGLLAQYMSGMKLSYLVFPIILSVGLSLFNAVLEKPMKLHYGKMKGIVIGYGVLLFSTVLLSGSLALAQGWQDPSCASGEDYARSQFLCTMTSVPYCLHKVLRTSPSAALLKAPAADQRLSCPAENSRASPSPSIRSRAG